MSLPGSRLLERAFPFDAAVKVTRREDLEGDLRSDVVYIIDGVIDMGASQIKVPQGGLYLQGFDFVVSGLTTSQASHTLFIDPDVGYAGNLVLRNMFVTVSGAGSQVFNLDNQENGGAVECTDFNFVSCTSIGTLSSYRQGLWSDFALISCTTGLTMDGTWSGGFAILTAIVISAGTPFTGTVLMAGASLVIDGSVRADLNALQIDDTGSISDFAPANITNDAQFRMIGVRCNPNSSPFPNMPASSTKARYSSCVGFRNTYVGGQWTITSEAVTTISAANTPVLVAGVTTYKDLNWFSGANDNEFVYESDEPIGIVIWGQLSFTGTTGNEINVIVRHWVAASSSYVDLSETGPFTLNASSRAENVSFHAFCDFSVNDRMEIWVENQTAANNVTAKIGGIASINERSS